MKKHLIGLLPFAFIVFLICAGCDKNESVSAKTKTELITQSSWKFEKATATGFGDISSNPFLACYIDNVITFSTNLSGTITEGAVVCSPPTPASFTWSFQNSESVLRLSFTLLPGGSPDFNIVSLNETNLVLSQEITIPGIGITTTAEVTFKH